MRRARGTGSAPRSVRPATTTVAPPLLPHAAPLPTTRPRTASGYDAIVVGAGPNGLAAAIAMARAGRRVLIREGASRVGGGMRSEEITLPGCVHDLCSAVHPLAVASPFFRALPLEAHGLRWLVPDVQLAHPLDDRPPALLLRGIDDTAATLASDGARYASLVRPFVERWDDLLPDALGPLHVPRHPVLLARFGLLALQSAAGLLRRRFEDERARVLLAGIAAHATIPLTFPASMSFGLVLAFAGHAVGWPIPEGGTQRLADALASYFRSLGGEIETDAPVRRLDELPPARDVFLDVTPRQFLQLAGHHMPAWYRRRMERFRYGPGSFKVDWTLGGPVPWRDPDCARAGTVHLGGTLDEMVASERAAWEGRAAERPYCIIAQPSAVDPSRTPAGRHVLWGYCHEPNGSPVDMTARIEAQIERFAPGFRDLILARRVAGPAALENYNPNYVGGDISGGANVLGQLFTRPLAVLVPYRTPLPGVWLCSSSTPPGGGVHGMCGYYAARAALGTTALAALGPATAVTRDA